MRKLNRDELPQAVEDYLGQCRGRIQAAEDEAAVAGRCWKNRRRADFQIVRETLRQMASGIERCMYCEDSEGTDIEHFWPKSRYPRRAFDWENYLLACSACNSNHKRTRFPLDANHQPLLIDPTVDEPQDHLVLSPTTGKFVGRTEKGSQSIDVYGLDREVLVRTRASAWVIIQVHLEAYAEAVARGEGEYATRIAAVFRELPQSGVLVELLAVARTAGASRYIRESSLKAIATHPEIASWLS
ncbi:MAG: HNH endonuclease [bacterium]|nr:HNH endonuclease [bacterium]